jgi:hypothetical protein
MSHDTLALIVLIRRLAAIDRSARERVARLLYIHDNQAAALLRIADGRAIAVDDLASAFDMSAGGVRAFAQSMVRAALVRTEPTPAHLPGYALRLAPGAADELAAALAPLTGALDPVAGTATSQLAAIVEAVGDACA